MYNVNDEVVVKLQRFDAPEKFFDAPGKVIEVIEPTHKYLIQFIPPLLLDEHRAIVQMECTPDLLGPN